MSSIGNSNRISREYLDYSHEQLGAEGEQRLKDCLKEILER